MVTTAEVRTIAEKFPRSYEVLVRDRVKFRVGRIVWLALSRDETTMGFAFPKEEREPMISQRPETFLPPSTGDLRYNWIVAKMSGVALAEAEELLFEAWTMAVPKRVVREYLLRPESRMAGA